MHLTHTINRVGYGRHVLKEGRNPWQIRTEQSTLMEQA